MLRISESEISPIRVSCWLGIAEATVGHSIVNGEERLEFKVVKLIAVFSFKFHLLC